MEAHHQSISLADTVLRSIASKKEQYTADVHKNAALLKLVADRFVTLPPMLVESMNDELLQLLEEQKTIVRSIAKDNVEREQYVKTFCQAVETIRERMGQGGGETVFASASQDPLLPVDYQKAIDDMMAFHASQQPLGVLYDNPLYSEIVDAMGDPKPAVTDSQKKKKQKRRRGGRVEEEDEDDDIEVMRNVETQASGSATAIASLKCPISRELMTDAVQNTQCHHIYSRAGITGLIQQSQAAGYHRTVKCPVVGCMNRNVTAAQLVDHYETSRQAQKEVRLQSQRKKLQDQANALMDTDDEE